MDDLAPDLLQWRYLEAAFQTISVLLMVYLATSFSHRIIHYRYFHPLSKVPGPFWAGVTRLWIAYQHLTLREPMVCEDLRKRYGPVVRITPTQVLVGPSSALPTIYHRRADKSSFYVSGSFGEVDNVFTTKEWASHARHRKPLAGSFSLSNVKKVEPLVDALIEQWMDKIAAEVSAKKRVFEWDTWPRWLTFDVITDIAFGAPFGCVETASDVGGVLKALRVGLPLAGLFMRLYPFTEWVKSTWAGRFLKVTPEDKSGWGIAMRHRDRLIERRLKELNDGTFSGRRDLLQAVLEARKDDGTPIDLETIKADMLVMLVAGGDTTGTAFQSLVRLTVANPSVYHTMMTELDAATRAGHLSATPKYDEVLRHCPYYIACIKEALRLYPSGSNIFARVVPPEGQMIEGMSIPGGTEVTCHAWLTGRDEALFGPNVEEFQPERWLESAEKSALYEKYNMVWGYGARVCLGKEVALMELYKAPLQFFRTYHVELEKAGTWQVSAGVAFWKNLFIRLEPRVPVEATSGVAA